MFKKIYIFAFSLFFCLVPIVAQERDPLKGARVSFLLQDVKTKEVVASVNPDLCVVPASVTKLITTASAIEIMGGDYRFTTTLGYDGYIDDEGTLHGNLIIRGGGDPTLGSAFMGNMNFIADWSQKIRGKGIKRIEGNIVADASCYNRNAIPITWCFEDVATHYGQGTFGLSLYDNICHITLESQAYGTRPKVLNVYPTIENFKIETPVEILKFAKDSIYIFGMPYENKRIIDGGMPANRNRYPVRCDIPNPPMLVAQLLRNRLIRCGVKVEGEMSDDISILQDSITVLFEDKSPQLREIIKQTNFKSNNMYAEHLLKQIGMTVNKSGASENDGISVLTRHWEQKGVDTDFLFLKDGSGMSPMNSYSARFLTDILTQMTKSECFDDFYESLPVAGREGTVAGFLRNTPLEGFAHVKSGSMSHVQCYAGYINYVGRRYAFAIMVNNYSCKRGELRGLVTKMLLDAVGGN